MFTRIASKCKTSSTSSSLLSSQFGSSSRLRSTSANFFEDLDPLLQRGLAALSVSSPTSFQTTAFSKIANTGEEKSDLVLSSETGSGKTLSYLLPILQNLLAAKTPSKYKTSTMIVVPNKELSQQLLHVITVLSGTWESVVWGGSDETRELFEKSGVEASERSFTVGVLPGGLNSVTDFRPFRSALSRPPEDFSTDHADVLIATPSTLSPVVLDIANLDLCLGVNTLVFDECDLLLDGGYLNNMRDILLGFRRKRKMSGDWGVAGTQTIFCGATVPDYGKKSVDEFIKRAFPEAERVEGSNVHAALHSGLTSIEWIEEDRDANRLNAVCDMLTEDEKKTLLFCNSGDAVDNVVEALESKGVRALAYHAKLRGAERFQNLQQFREEGSPVLVATDAAARGLDIPGVERVIQLQWAGNVVAHLHRIGRVGRGGSKGNAVVFYGSSEADLVQIIRDAEGQKRLVVEGDVDGDDEDGKVNQAFSRKRGFRKKKKKSAKEARGE
ncbi:hypothetical protein TrVE_jg8056 [Triparma verrucosa]|uniref:ATP-dependent RNA helicase n=1 Tax=Triparma verrucosa TaxID=1606542 RepID=A0A9W7ETJ4_9STRA|nr:hypothetical protein TrVE_jg8056 [Triparma verrucosa]